MKLRLLAGCVSATLLAACSESTVSGSNTSTRVTTSTVKASTTTTTSSTSTTSTSTTSTTTTTSTIPVVNGLDLSADGLGEESFGAEATGVISYVQTILGPPTHDTGWLDPLATGAACRGTEIRYVTWDDLSLFFTDDSTFASGLRHFASFNYGPAAGTFVDPFGLSVEGGITVGDTVDELLAIYPDAVINDSELGGALFHIVDGLGGFLTGTTGSDTITTFVGGFGCGE